jgi:hypothetical protein
MVVYRGPLPADPELDAASQRLATEERCARLARCELGAAPYLIELCGAIPDGALQDCTPDECLGLIQDAAWSYYYALWTACTPEEQLTLVQLVDEGLINPKRALCWEDLRVPILCVLGVLAYVVANTQQAVYDSLLVFGSALASVGVPSMASLVTMFLKGKMASNPTVSGGPANA